MLDAKKQRKLVHIGELTKRRSEVLEELETIDKDIGYFLGLSDEEETEVTQPKKKVSKKAADTGAKPAKNDTRERVLTWHNKGWEPDDIAEKIGMSTAAVYHHLRAEGLTANKKKAKYERLEEAAASTRTGRGKNACGICGKTGHKRKTCPNGNTRGVESFETRQKAQTECSLSPEIQEQVKDMRERDMTTTEIARELNVDKLEVEKVMSRKSELYVAPKARPLSAEEFNDVKTAMKDPDFMSGSYALSHKLSPREVNLAVTSTSYDEYIEKGLDK